MMTVTAIPANITQAHRWRVLQEDFPHLSTPPPTASEPIGKLVNTLREDPTADCVQESALKLLASLP